MATLTAELDPNPTRDGDQAPAAPWSPAAPSPLGDSPTASDPFDDFEDDDFDDEFDDDFEEEWDDDVDDDGLDEDGQEDADDDFGNDDEAEFDD